MTRPDGRIGKAKTETSHDYVPLAPVFAQVLLEWRGSRRTGAGLPFSHHRGFYYAGIIQKQILRPRGEQVGFSGLGWHTFPHTYRSLLDETGAPVGVQQKLMRHSNVATTMNVYGNATHRAKAQANSKVVGMLMQQNQLQTVQEFGSCSVSVGSCGVAFQRIPLNPLECGSSGRTRTYNPSVNSRMLCH